MRKHLNLPPRMRKRVRGNLVYFYYDLGGKPRRELKLGTDYALAVKKWTELEQDRAPAHCGVVTVPYVIARYEREELPKLKPQTRRVYAQELKWLQKFFGGENPAPIDEIKPLHITQYREWRKDAPICANKEIVLFSHIFNLAREWGYTDANNPCLGIAKNPDPGRKVYVDDALYQRVLDAADQPTRDAMELAYLTGQRPGDTLKLAETDVRDGAIWVEQQKTGEKVRIEIVGQLAAVLARITDRKRDHNPRTLSLVCDERGQPLTQPALRARFDKARAKAGVAKALFQFRDLRSKAGTDKEEAAGLEAAQHQLGHRNSRTTLIYVRNRKGRLVKPTK